jgi:hypothetical protein
MTKNQRGVRYALKGTQTLCGLVSVYSKQTRKTVHGTHADTTYNPSAVQNSLIPKSDVARGKCGNKMHRRGRRILTVTGFLDFLAAAQLPQDRPRATLYSLICVRVRQMFECSVIGRNVLGGDGCSTVSFPRYNGLFGRVLSKLDGLQRRNRSWYLVKGGAREFVVGIDSGDDDYR